MLFKNRTPKQALKEAPNTRNAVALDESQLSQVTGGVRPGMIATPKWIVLESTPDWVVGAALGAGYEVEVLR